MIDNQIFAWDNYEENPLNVEGLTTRPVQKEATWQNTPNSVFTGNVIESFFTNEDKGSDVNISDVIGEEPKDLVYGEGYVDAE